MLRNLTIKDFLDKLSSKKPTPGGGSASALSGALAAGLVAMAAKFSGEEIIADKSERFMKVLIELIDKDADAFEKVIREKSSQDSLKEATEIPLQTARYAKEVLKLAEVLSRKCNPKVASDLEVAREMAEAAVKSALLNVKVNLVSIRDEEFKKEIGRAINSLF